MYLNYTFCAGKYRKSGQEAGAVSDQKPENSQEPKKPVNVTGGRGVVVGDFNQVVQNFLADPRMRWYLLALGVLVIAASIALYFGLSARNQQITESSLRTAIPPTPTSPPKFMSGNINIAVSEFVLTGTAGDPLLGRKLAENLYKNLDAQVQQLRSAGALDLPEVWRPDQFEPVTGATPEARAAAAGLIARKYHMHILIYGVVDTDSGAELRVTPEFTISDRDFYDAREITGPYELGAPFAVKGEPFSAPFNVLLNRQMTPRVQTLALLIEGLSYYVTRDFPRALDVLGKAADSPDRLPKEGREVVYLLAGNAAQQAGQYEQAGRYYDLSLGEDGQYARAMIGKGSVFYLQAIQPFAQSKQVKDVDQELLSQSMEWYKQALNAAHQPSQADIAVKVHFGLGQDLYYRVLTGQDTHFDAAIAELQAVLDAYARGDDAVKLRIRDMAGNAHGHLGLIYEQAGRKDLAVREYEQAAALLKDSFDTDRQQYYEQRAAKLKGG